MKINKIALCFADMDRIIVEPGHSKDGVIPIEEQIKKYDLSKVTGYVLSLEMSPAEFLALRSMGQVITSDSSTMNLIARVHRGA